MHQMTSFNCESRPRWLPAVPICDISAVAEHLELLIIYIYIGVWLVLFMLMHSKKNTTTIFQIIQHTYIFYFKIQPCFRSLWNFGLLNYVIYYFTSWYKLVLVFFQKKLTVLKFMLLNKCNNKLIYKY